MTRARPFQKGVAFLAHRFSVSRHFNLEERIHEAVQKSDPLSASADAFLVASDSLQTGPKESSILFRLRWTGAGTILHANALIASRPRSEAMHRYELQLRYGDWQYGASGVSKSNLELS